MVEPSKEYRARIRVKLTDDILPSPSITKAEVETLLVSALRAGESDSPILSVTVSDPRG